MIILIQRVLEASVRVQGKEVAMIQQGILALVAVERGDTEQIFDKMCKKLLHYRIFADHEDKMNLNVQQIEGDILLVPQFTLAAETRKGMRPSFSLAAPPEQAKQGFADFCLKVEKAYPSVQTGIFGADMQVSLINDGPVTFYLQINA